MKISRATITQQTFIYSYKEVIQNCILLHAAARSFNIHFMILQKFYKKMKRQAISVGNLPHRILLITITLFCLLHVATLKLIIVYYLFCFRFNNSNYIRNSQVLRWSDRIRNCQVRKSWLWDSLWYLHIWNS